MVLVVQPGEPIGGELLRVASATTASAIEHLRRLEEDPIGAVHEARRNIRSLLALSRLLRPLLGAEAYRLERDRLREAAGLLSPHRDAHVQLATLDGLAESASLAGRVELEWTRRMLAPHLESACGDLADHGAAAGVLLRASADSLGSRGPAELPDAGAVIDGLRRSAKRARKSERQARDDPAPENLHELRKRCKDVREQIRVLMPLEPDTLGRIERGYDRVCSLLGEARDLQMLRASLASIREELPEADGVIAALASLAGERERELTARALRRSRRATARAPKKLASLAGLA